MDWNFFFFPWFEKESNKTNPKYVTITDEKKEYFDRIEKIEKVTLDDSQRAWYVMKEKDQGLMMTQEHPSTSDEAFFSSVSGAFWADEIRDLERRFPPQITDVPHDKKMVVHTIHDPGYHWAIWFVQDPMGVYPKFLRYYEFVGEGTEHCCEILDRYKELYGYRYGKHVVPIDADSNATKVIDGRTILMHAKRNGYNFTKMKRIADSLTLIEKTRQSLTNFWFNREGTEKGVEAAVAFRRKIDRSLSTDKKPVYLNKYVHDHASHGSTALYHFVKARDAGLFEDTESNSITIEEIRRLNKKYQQVMHR